MHNFEMEAYRFSLPKEIQDPASCGESRAYSTLESTGDIPKM